jgi:hypothetical protein
MFSSVRILSGFAPPARVFRAPLLADRVVEFSLSDEEVTKEKLNDF